MTAYTISFIHGISRVHIFPKLEDREREVREVTTRHGFLWRKTTTEVCVCSWHNEIPVNDWLEDRPFRYIEDNRIFYKPHADIHYTDGKVRTNYFETVDELTEFANTIKELGAHVIL